MPQAKSLIVAVCVACFVYVLPVLTVVHAAATTTHKVQEVVAEKSGITAWLIEDKSLPMLSLQLAFTGCGAISDEDGKEGRASMVSDLLSEGAGDMDAVEFRRALQANAIDLGFSVDEDHFYASLKTLSANRDKAFELLALAITRPRFDGDAVENIRARQLTVIRKLEERPSHIANRSLRKHLFPDHQYGRTPYGSENSITALTTSQLAQLPQKYFAANNMVIAVAGDITATELATLLDKYFSPLPEEAEMTATVEEAEPHWFDKPVVITRDIPQAVVRFALPALKRSSPDFYALYLMNHILGGGTLTSRLAYAIREEKGLAYYANSYVDIQQHANVISGRFGTRNDKVAAATEIMRRVIRNAAVNGFTQEELEHARDYVTGSFPLRLDSTTALANYLLIMQLHNLGKDYLHKRNEYFNAVTLDDINRIAKKMLATVEPAIVVVGAGKTNIE